VSDIFVLIHNEVMDLKQCISLQVRQIATFTQGLDLLGESLIEESGCDSFCRVQQFTRWTEAVLQIELEFVDVGVSVFNL